MQGLRGDRLQIGLEVPLEDMQDFEHEPRFLIHEEVDGVIVVPSSLQHLQAILHYLQLLLDIAEA